MAEVHFIGQIVGASGFGRRALLCKWGIEASDSTWDKLEGYDTGQTQTDYPKEDDMAVWAHPIDIHYQCLGLSGWPKLHFQVWTSDKHGRTDICGYGFTNLPTAPGMFDLECPLWLPEGTAGAFSNTQC